MPLMNLKIIILSEKSDTEMWVSYGITHIWYLIFTMMQMNLFTEQKQTYRYKNKHMFIRRETRSGRGKLRGWDEQAHTAVYKIDNKQEPTV